MLNIAVEELVPSQLLAIWRCAYPAEGEIYFPLKKGYSLRDLHSKLDLGVIETAGALGPTWIILMAGNRFSSPCKRGHLFSWHYHPDGDTRFSIDDWIAFIISKAQLTLLFTINYICLYVKFHEKKCKKITKAIVGEENFLDDKPNLRFLRFMKFMSKELEKPDWTLCDESQIASTLGISYKKYAVK